MADAGKEKPAKAPQEKPESAPTAPGKTLPAEVKKSLEEGHQQLAEMRAKIGMPKKSPFGETEEKPAAETAAAPSEKPKPEEQKPEAVPEGVPTTEQLHKMSNSELMGKLLESVGQIAAFWKKGTEKVTAQVAAVTQKVNEKFSDEELQKIAVDLNKDKEKVYPSQDKSVEFVCTVLGLPVKENPAQLLNSFKNSGLVFETDQGKLKEAQPGDVVFFQKEEKKGEPYLAAVVSSADPLKVKMIPRTGGAATEVTLLQSDYFKIEWMGFVKLPRSQKPPEIAAAEPPKEAPESPSKAPEA